jgi:hypothetical protein
MDNTTSATSQNVFVFLTHMPPLCFVGQHSTEKFVLLLETTSLGVPTWAANLRVVESKKFGESIVIMMTIASKTPIIL